MLTNEAEIRDLFHKLQKKRSHVTGHFENGKHIFSTCVLDVDGEHVILENVSDDAISQRILAASHLEFSLIHAGVPVNFVSSLIESCLFEGEVAFCIPLPASVRWLQQREFFGVPTPIIKPALCEINLENGEIARNPLSDISVGGIGMLMQESAPALEEGALFRECHIDLPAFGVMTSDIRIRNSADVTLRSGSSARRYGCQFINLPHQKQSLLQRYVTKLELTVRAAQPN